MRAGDQKQECKLEWPNNMLVHEEVTIFVLQAEREVPQTDGGVFRKLSKHMEHMFEKDFPFYVTIAYRVHK